MFFSDKKVVLKERKSNKKKYIQWLFYIRWWKLVLNFIYGGGMKKKTKKTLYGRGFLLKFNYVK